MKLLKRAAGISAGVFLASTVWAARTLTRKGVRTSVDSAFFYTPFELGLNYELVSFHNAEGLRLRGWWMPSDVGSKKVIIGAPGYGRSKSDLLGIGAQLVRAGYNVLLFDFRDQGESEPAVSTIGHYELDDMEAAIEYAEWRVPDLELGLIGYSMGAAVSLVAAASHPEIRCVVSDSAFADLGQVLHSMFRSMTHLPASPAVELTEFIVWARAGYRFSKVRPLDVIGKIAPRPILLIHGEQDNIAPVADALALYEAAGAPKELWIEPTCSHCGAYFIDRLRYVDRVVGFFRTHLGDPHSGDKPSAVRLPAQPAAQDLATPADHIHALQNRQSAFAS